MGPGLRRDDILERYSSFPRKRESRATGTSLALDPRFRGGDEKDLDSADQGLAPRLPDRFVVAERHRGARPKRRRLGQLHYRLQMAEAPDRGIARGRPARQLLRRELLR